MEKEIKMNLFKGGCARRYNCKNINKRFCNPIPKDEDNFIICKYYLPSLNCDETSAIGVYNGG